MWTSDGTQDKTGAENHWAAGCSVHAEPNGIGRTRHGDAMLNHYSLPMTLPVPRALPAHVAKALAANLRPPLQKLKRKNAGISYIRPLCPPPPVQWPACSGQRYAEPVPRRGLIPPCSCFQA